MHTITIVMLPAPDALTLGAAQAAQLLRGWIKSDGSL